MSRFAALCADPAATVITAELPTVDGGGLAVVRRHLESIAPWVDAVNATDNPAAHAHTSNVAVAIAIAQHGAEPILQVVCRDKNRLALEADIMGASMFGIENVCCLTGDDVTAGDEPEARRVFDLDGPQLVRLATRLAAGTYLSGRPIKPPPPLFVGAVENPGAPPLSHRAERAAKKIEAGARFLQLQMCYHPDRLESFIRSARDLGATAQAAFMATICLVRGAGPLRFIHEHVPGIDVPATLIDRVAGAPDPSEAAYQLSLDQARHALSLPGIRGLHLVDFRKDDSIARLVTDLGLGSRHAVDAMGA